MASYWCNWWRDELRRRSQLREVSLPKSVSMKSMWMDPVSRGTSYQRRVSGRARRLDCCCRVCRYVLPESCPEQPWWFCLSHWTFWLPCLQRRCSLPSFRTTDSTGAVFFEAGSTGTKREVLAGLLTGRWTATVADAAVGAAAADWEVAVFALVLDDVVCAERSVADDTA